MREYLNKITHYLDQFRSLSVDSLIYLVLFGCLAAFGILNVLLGYRLLRFWMMLGGFAIGAGLGYLLSDVLELTDRGTMLAISLGIGILLGLIAFFIYRAGIFMLGAGIGLIVSVYIIHPMSSASFFACVLIGLGIGVLGVKFARPVVIIATSIAGGALAGIAIAKLAGLPEFPYGLLIGLVLAFLGILIQFATNKPKLIIETDDDGQYEKEDEQDTVPLE